MQRISNPTGPDGEEGDRGVAADAGVLVGRGECFQLRDRLGCHRPAPLGLAGQAAEGVGGIATHAGDRIVEQGLDRGDGPRIGVWSRSEMHHHRTRGVRIRQALHQRRDAASVRTASRSTVALHPPASSSIASRMASPPPRNCCTSACSRVTARKARPEPSGWRGELAVRHTARRGPSGPGRSPKSGSRDRLAELMLHQGQWRAYGSRVP